MALFKINKGDSANLPSEIHEGWAYVTQDKGEFFVDIDTKTRKELNPQADWNETDASSRAYIVNKPAALDADVTSDSETLIFDPIGVMPENPEMVAIANGGTGASDTASARKNLGVNLPNLGITASAAELNYMDGVTSNVQIQLDSKQSTVTVSNGVLAF